MIHVLTYTVSFLNLVSCIKKTWSCRNVESWKDALPEDLILQNRPVATEKYYTENVYEIGGEVDKRECVKRGRAVNDLHNRYQKERRSRNMFNRGDGL